METKITIYKIQNKINKKVYIGQSTNFSRRMSGHKTNSKYKNGLYYNLPLYKEMREYGIENFTFEPVCEVNSVEKATEYENLLMTAFKSLNPEFGYNSVRGCNAGHNSKKSSFKEKNHSYGKKGSESLAVHKRIICLTTNTIYESIKECAEDIFNNRDISKYIGRVADPNSNRTQYKGYQFAFLDENNNPIQKNTVPMQSSKFKVLEKINNVTYNSVREASKALGLSETQIRDRIYGRVKKENDKYNGIYEFCKLEK